MKGPIDFGVFVAVRNEYDEYLLVRHGYGEEKWSLPGGGLEQGEVASDGAVREAKEETGYDIEVGQLIGIFAQKKKLGQVILFEGKIKGGEIVIRDSGEITACGFMKPERILMDEIYPGQLNLIRRAEEFRGNGQKTIFGLLTKSQKQEDKI